MWICVHWRESTWRAKFGVPCSGREQASWELRLDINKRQVLHFPTHSTPLLVVLQKLVWLPRAETLIKEIAKAHSIFLFPVLSCPQQLLPQSLPTASLAALARGAQWLCWSLLWAAICPLCSPNLFFWLAERTRKLIYWLGDWIRSWETYQLTLHLWLWVKHLISPVHQFPHIN